MDEPVSTEAVEQLAAVLDDVLPLEMALNTTTALRGLVAERDALRSVVRRMSDYYDLDIAPIGPGSTTPALWAHPNGAQVNAWTLDHDAAEAVLRALAEGGSTDG